MKNKKQIIVLISCVVAGSILFIYLTSQTTTPLQTVSDDISTEDKARQDEQLADQKQAALENPTTASDNSKPVPESNIILSAQQEQNDTVTVFTKLFGVSDGSCTLVISNGSRSTTQAAPVIFQSEFSSCAGFSVPISSIGNGKWSIQLTLTRNGLSSTKTIEHEVN